jgi:hypothetical protein
VKRWLVAYSFPATEGWKVTVDIDSMERGVAGQHPPDKKTIADECEKWLRQQGVEIVAHPLYGRADLVATKEGCTFVIEVEGDSSRQREQAMYSALGQIVLSMRNPSPQIIYGLAVPDSSQWETQLKKIPPHVREILKLNLFLVSKTGVRQLMADVF